ncbi:MAG: FprA family A-type flavoprotein [Nitrospirae bacterium]|nr:FprA family A-type flavoprotein [Nitrospirota bacterium]
MNAGIPLNDQIYWVGVNDRQTALFEELWPIPDGIAYNSYLILDDQVAIVDGVKDISIDRYIGRIRSLLGGRPVSYLVINHIEPDHSGAIRALCEAFPGMKIVGNKKTMDLLEAFYGIRENLQTVNDGDTLELGKCRLQFHITPMVHWPETMMTYESSHKILFSGDVFGGFSAIEEGIFDDESGDIRRHEDEMLRYFVNVIGKYSVMVQKALAKIRHLDIRMLASTHGLVWRSRPDRAIELYDRWSRYEAEQGAVIVYASMYGNTEKIMETIANSLADARVGIIKVHNVSRVHASYILSDIWRYRAVILGSPTYNTGLFPLMDHLVRLLENKMLRNRIAGLFGSYGWSGGAVKEMTGFVSRMEWDLTDPVIEVKCSATDEDLNKCSLLGSNIAQRLRE